MLERENARQETVCLDDGLDALHEVARSLSYPMLCANDRQRTSDARRARKRALSSPPAALTAQGAGMSFAEVRALRRAAAAAAAVDRVTNRRFAADAAALRPAARDAVAVTSLSESSRRSR